MRIAQVSTLATPVARLGSGSIEGLVWLLSRELVRRGEEVTVFAAHGSETDGELVATLPGIYARDGSPSDWHVCEWVNLCRAVERAGRFDVIHSHSYFNGMPLAPLSTAPMIHTLHINADDDFAQVWRLHHDAHVTALSDYQWSLYPDLHPAAVIHHGVDADQFTFRAEPADYVCFLGRFTPDKGPLAAIEIARSLGVPLLLAGPTNDYFAAQVQPLVDGHSVRYVGAVSGAARDELLGGARALVYPIAKPEPFGLVLIEAMACGTPVVASRTGAVPELVDEGLTGYLAADVDGFVSRLKAAFRLDRAAVRRRAVERFSATRMAGQYEQAYERLLGRTREHPDMGRRVRA
jgi:glycosyltransferase involved in cell wall biosynthesis